MKSIYLSIRDIAAFMSGDSRQGFSQVVSVNVQGMQLIGFVTTEDPKGLPGSTAADKLIGGYTVYLPKSKVEPLELSLEDAMRITLSGGVSANNRKAKKTKAA